MITKDIKYIGVNDREIDLFEGQYIVPDGMAYNSYVILDEKVAVADTVDAAFVEQWFENLESALEGRTPDYLIVHHMEPDHSAGIAEFVKRYPAARIVATDKAVVMMKKFFGIDFSKKADAVKDGDSLSLGRHTLNFYTAPMVHWPEVMMSYDAADKVLFSADAFGKFGALDCDDEWACEARRYYFGIVGKYGVQVQAVLKKLGGLDIAAICPLHGPVLKENLGYYLDLYNIWSSYGVESEGIAIAYCSVYGHTKEAVELLARELEDAGCPKVAVSDLARDDMAEAVEDAFRYGTLVLVSTTYNGDMFPFMKEFIDHLADHAFQNRRIAFMENGTWAPTAARAMKGKVEALKGMEFVEPVVTIKSALDDTSRAAIHELASALMA